MSFGCSKSARPSRWAAWMLVSLAVALLGGCSADSPPRNTQISGNPRSTKSDDPLPNLGQERPRVHSEVHRSDLASIPEIASVKRQESVATEIARLDVHDDDWATEAFSDRAAEQLKKLAHLLETPRWDPVSVGKLASPEARFVMLRPPLQQAYTDDTIRVLRGKTTSNDSDGKTGQSTLLLSDALEELCSEFTDGSHRHAKFKIFRVEAASPRASTTVYVELSSHAREVNQQYNLTWQIAWDMSGDSSPPRITGIEVLAHEEVTVHNPPGGKLFEDCTQAVLGHHAWYARQCLLGTEHWQTQLDSSFGIDVAALEGLAIGDVNGDGFEDVYLCQGGGRPNRLLIHQPDGRVQDRAAEAGVDWLDLTRAALILDFDNDGDQDLAIAFRFRLLLMENNGQGEFTVRQDWRSFGQLFSLAAADYDQDGDLDIYVCARNGTEKDFEHGVLGTPLPFHDANNGARNALLRNQAEWNFIDVTEEVGLEQNNRRFSYAASWNDFDLDGDLDLYVANDHGRNNLYRNEEGHFTDIAAAAGVEDISAGMSVSWGDPNRDGRPDIYVSNMFSSAGERITYQRRFHGDADQTLRAQYQRHARGNTLFENAGDGTFRDQSVVAGVTMGRWAWGSLFADLNNDGWEDLYVANGFITGPNPDDL